MLKNRYAIITGANGGIGRAIIKNFAENGANIYACARSANEEFENYLNGISEKYAVNIKPIYFDMQNPVEMKNAVKDILQDKQKIDILVNNAGVAKYDTFSFLSMELLKEIFDINYFSQLQFTQLISRRMNKTNGSIVFVSSIAALTGVSGNTAYGGSKAALAHTTKVLSKELAGQGIRVNAVAPGMVETAMKKQANEEIWSKLIEGTSLKRVAQPEEVANVICFLASDLSSYITGQIIRVDGGMD